jgi:large subunit ribosomal protein L23
MGIFNRLKKLRQPEGSKEPEGDKQIENAAEQTAGPVLQPQKTSRKRLDIVAIAPRISEKAAVLASAGKYVFDVPVTANKSEIRKAVEALYGVKVAEVNTLRGIGKRVRRGRIAGRRNRWKKAVVLLHKGQKIDLFVGV